MKKLIIFFLSVINIVEQDCLSQEVNKYCYSEKKNDKRYEIATGTLKYDVYSTNGKGKKKNKLFKVNVVFREYGKDQTFTIDNNNSIKNESLAADFSSYLDSSNFFLNFLVPDICSNFYTGISLVKPVEEKYKSEMCLKFMQFRFSDSSNSTNMGTVKYCKGIPVYVRGGIRNKYLIWELQGLPE